MTGGNLKRKLQEGFALLEIRRGRTASAGARRALFLTGFTLLEMVFSLGIFSVLVVATIGVTLGVSKAEHKAAAVQSIQDNIRFSLELLTKELRTGSNYALTSLCGAAGSEISFDTATGERRTYFRNGATEAIMRATESITSADCNDSTKAKPFSGEEILVSALTFQTSGLTVGPGDGQPRITISLRVRSRDPKYGQESAMNLQTTVVQRLRDF